MRRGQEGWAAQREFSRGALELAVLALIQGRPRYGYDPLTSLGEATDGFLAVKEGTVYPVLHRLEDAGYLSASWEAEGRGVPRKYYTITPAGRRRFFERLGITLSRRPVVQLAGQVQPRRKV